MGINYGFQEKSFLLCNFVVDFENGYVIMDGMEPSNDNSFGSFGVSGSGGGVPGGVNPGGVGVNSGNASVNPGVSGINSGNAGGMNMNYMMPVGSGAGDIVIGEDGSTKSKKWLVICGAIFGIVVVGLLGWLAVESIMKNSVPSTGDLKQSFNKFANYVLSGEELTTEINPELDVFYNYYFTNGVSVDNDRKELYEHTSALFTPFLEMYERTISKGHFSSDDEKLTAVANDEVQLLEFFSAVYVKPEIAFEDIIDVYGKGGADGVKQYLDDYYHGDTENPYYSGFSDYLKKWVDWQVKALDVYNSKGCIVDGTIKQSCSIDSEEDKAKVRGYNKNARNAKTFLDSYYNLSDNYVLNVFVMNALVNNGDVTLYVTGGGANAEE